MYHGINSAAVRSTHSNYLGGMLKMRDRAKELRMREQECQHALTYLSKILASRRVFAYAMLNPAGQLVVSGGKPEAFGFVQDTNWPLLCLNGDPEPTAPSSKYLSLNGGQIPAILHISPATDFTWYFLLDNKSKDTKPSPENQSLEKQDILLHTIIHDLSSPLSGIMGCLEALEDTTKPSDRKRLVELALKQAHRQEQLIRQILDVFKADQEDTGDLFNPPIDIIAITEELIESSTPRFNLHKVSLDLVDQRSEDFRWVMAEETRLGRVLSNLLDNSLRHAPEHSTIQVVIGGNREMVEVSILDEGPGVPQIQRPTLFEKFRQGHNRGRLGLGLYFCRITVERWGGLVGYSPRNEGGAKFWFKLPWIPASLQNLRPKRTIET